MRCPKASLFSPSALRRIVLWITIFTSGAFPYRRVLNQALKDMKKLTSRNSVKRFIRHKDDTEKISGFKEKIKNAVDILLVSSAILVLGVDSLRRMFRPEPF
jgi:hypothetical protein